MTRRASAVHHVVAGLLVRSRQVFLCHRSAGRPWYPNVWDLPGGHIEELETPPVALVRELHEELGITIPEPIESEFARLQLPDLDCHIWVVREWTGTPHVASDEHDDAAWWFPEEAEDLPLAVERYRDLFRLALSASKAGPNPDHRL